MRVSVKNITVITVNAVLHLAVAAPNPAVRWLLKQDPRLRESCRGSMSSSGLLYKDRRIARLLCRVVYRHLNNHKIKFVLSLDSPVN